MQFSVLHGPQAEREVRVREVQRTEADEGGLCSLASGGKISWLLASLQLQPFANLDSTSKRLQTTNCLEARSGFSMCIC